MSDPILDSVQAFAQGKVVALSVAEDSVKSTALAAKNAIEAAAKARVESTAASVALKAVKAAVEIDGATPSKVSHIVAAGIIGAVVVGSIIGAALHYGVGL